MPELPEVETVRETLKQLVLGKKIKDVTVYWDNIIDYPSVLELTDKIKNQTIVDIERVGKFLIFILDNNVLVSHLRMEGKYYYKKSNEEHLKHEHVIFHFDDDTDLRYHDTRKFGKMQLLNKDNYLEVEPLNKVGYEPWNDKLTIEYLKEKFKNKTIPIKTTLLDQSIIAGLGNIYVDEVLFLSKIHPSTITNVLDDDYLEVIIKNSKKVLEKAIELGGTTIRSYTSSLGVTGRFQNELFVHQRKDKECLICGSNILKMTVNGRGTYYCPVCQKVIIKNT